MSQTRRDQSPRAAARQAADHTPLCPLTGVTIPECSCRLCIEAQIRRHSPDLLVRRVSEPRR